MTWLEKMREMRKISEVSDFACINWFEIVAVIEAARDSQDLDVDSASSWDTLTKALAALKKKIEEQ